MLTSRRRKMWHLIKQKVRLIVGLKDQLMDKEKGLINQILMAE